jgi:hypothetical protein
MTATVTIGPRERDALHGLMLHRLFILGERPLELAGVEGVTVEQLGEEFGEDLRLMEDLGWTFESDRKLIDLTMPPGGLAKTVKRLRRDARRAPSEKRHEREPEETDEERWDRFRRAVDACEEVLDLLDSRSRDEGAQPSAAGCRRPGVEGFVSGGVGLCDTCRRAPVKFRADRIIIDRHVEPPGKRRPGPGSTPKRSA